jgi:tricorn protease-like protein
VTSDEDESNLYILDLSTDRITKSNHGFPSDWSSDGRWMLFFEDGNPLLFAPETDQELDIPLDIPGCYSAVWTEQE